MLNIYAHQTAALAFCEHKAYYALLMEQGTGKTLVEILDTVRRYRAGAIAAVLVLAPNGVQTNWLRVERTGALAGEVVNILPPDVALVGAHWASHGHKAQQAAQLERKGLWGVAGFERPSAHRKARL